MNETIWTTSTSPLIDPTIGGVTSDKLSWDPDYWTNATKGPDIRDVIPLEAKTRVNSTTLASKDIETVKEIVKDKLYKQLLEQLMSSGCVKIESVKNPANNSITFTARIELVQPKAVGNETRKAA